MQAVWIGVLHPSGQMKRDHSKFFSNSVRGKYSTLNDFTNANWIEEDGMYLQVVRFEKAGEEILSSVTKEMAKFEEKKKVLHAEMAPILKEWEVTEKDVQEMVEDRNGYESMSGKFSNSNRYTSNAATNRVGILKEMEEALKKISKIGLEIKEIQNDIDALDRVRRNIVDTKTYMLNYEDLEVLGF